MVDEKVYLNNGTLFANGFERVVHGGRGDYVEFTGEQIVPKLFQKFTFEEFDEKTCSKNVDFYYYYLYPEHNGHVKVYYQLKTVKYADYKIGYYYVSPSLLSDDFRDPEKLF